VNSHKLALVASLQGRVLVGEQVLLQLAVEEAVEMGWPGGSWAQGEMLRG